MKILFSCMCMYCNNTVKLSHNGKKLSTCKSTGTTVHEELLESSLSSYSREQVSIYKTRSSVSRLRQRGEKRIAIDKSEGVLIFHAVVQVASFMNDTLSVFPLLYVHVRGSGFHESCCLLSVHRCPFTVVGCSLHPTLCSIDRRRYSTVLGSSIMMLQQCRKYSLVQVHVVQYREVQYEYFFFSTLHVLSFSLLQRVY